MALTAKQLAAERIRRRKKGAKPFKAAACGTRSGFKKHKNDGTDPCGPCVNAERDYHQARDARRAKERIAAKERAKNPADPELLEQIEGGLVGWG